MCLPALWKFPDINKIRANVALGSSTVGDLFSKPYKLKRQVPEFSTL